MIQDPNIPDLGSSKLTKVCFTKCVAVYLYAALQRKIIDQFPQNVLKTSPQKVHEKIFGKILNPSPCLQPN